MPCPTTSSCTTHLLSQIPNDVPRVQLDKRLPNMPRHPIDITRMTPIRIVYRSKPDSILTTSYSSHEHVGSVERVNEIGRHAGCLFLSDDFGDGVGIGDIDGLKGGHGLLKRKRRT